jgi:Tol biopolymer transport system component
MKPQAEIWDLSLYDVRTGTTRRLTADGTLTREEGPRFSTADSIAFFANDENHPRGTFYELSLDGSAPNVVFRSSEPVLAYDLKSDGSIVYVTQPSDGTAINIYIYSGSRNRLLRRFPPHIGRGGDQSDEFSIRWSPDETHLLFVDTALDYGRKTAPSMFVLNADGSNALPARIGTFARWSADGCAIYYRDVNARASAGSAWHALVPSFDTGRPTTKSLHIERGRFRPSVSFDGRHVALDDGEGAEPGLFVYDIASDTESRVAAGAGVSPVWLASDTIAVSGTKACVQATCDYSPWERSGKGFVFTLGGARTASTLTNTLDADVLLEA